MKTSYHGSCHCKAVTFEADFDIEAGTTKCNCTFCWKQRMWKTEPFDPADFRLLSGADALRSHGSGPSRHHFCTRCGIYTHNDGRLEQAGGAFMMVYVAALDDLPVEALLAAPVRYQNGLHDDWGHPPAETRQL